MKVCVTGGAGFIGSHLTDAYLAAGHDVVVLDNFVTGKEVNVAASSARIVRMSLNHPDLDAFFDDERFDIVNHHAAHMELRVSLDSPLHDAESNILGSIRVMEAARRNGVQHLVLASTGGAVYGVQDYYPADENHPTRPESPYAVAKRSMELYADYYRTVQGLSITTMRYTNVYGPRQNPFGEAGVIAIFLQKWIDGGTPYMYGDGEQTRDYIYISDVVRANMIATERRLQGIYNCCTGIETSLNTIVDNMRKAYHGATPIHQSEAKAGDLRRSVCSSRKLQDETGWHPVVGVEEGIGKTVAWFTR